jgi:hypothetical protein
LNFSWRQVAKTSNGWPPLATNLETLTRLRIISIFSACPVFQPALNEPSSSTNQVLNPVFLEHPFMVWPWTLQALAMLWIGIASMLIALTAWAHRTGSKKPPIQLEAF